jgi:phytoene dehydrogenase-like protein
MEGARAAAFVTASGEEVRARRFICNADPRWLVDTMGRAHFPSTFLSRVDTEYSASSMSLYLGVRGIDLRDHGFGNWNVWHYPRLDLNDIYRAQHERDDLSDPWLFLSTPTLCSPRAKTRHAPEGEQILEIITTCAYEPFARLKQEGVAAYTARKNAVRDRMIELVEQHYVPRLREHVVMRVAGTPTTNLHYVRAPKGAIYGSALTPWNVDASRLGPRTPIDNLYLVGASASFPSVGGTVGGGNRLYTLLTGDRVA